MDLDVIKKRLNDFQSQANNSGGNSKNLFWKPSVGKQLIRVVPSKYNPSNPFTEMMFYYGIGSKKVMASPGKEVYQEFLNMAADDEIGDFTDIAQGRDIKLSTVGPESTGTPYNKTSIGPSLKTSTLADTEDGVKQLRENQADPMKIFKPLTYDEMKTSLQEWLSPEGEDDEEGSISSEPAVAFDNEPKSNYSLDIKNVKQTKADKFEDLFSDEKTDDLPF